MPLMKRLPLFVLLFLVSCQEMTTPRANINAGASTSLDSELFDGPWVLQDQACDLSNNCEDIDRKLTFSSTKMVMKVYYKNTVNLYPGMSKTYMIVSASAGKFRMNTGSNLVDMTYTINGNTLDLCDDMPNCYTYHR